MTSMGNPNHTKVVQIPYPGRDVAILSLVVLLIPVVGPLVAFVLARSSKKESKFHGYPPLGVQKIAELFAALGILLMVIWLLVLVLFLTGVFAPIDLPSVDLAPGAYSNSV